MSSMRELAIPGVRCGKCLGRIDQWSIDFKRRLHDRLHPGQPFTPPLLCSVCWHGAVMEFAFGAEDDDACSPPADGGGG